jgi:hypothetical protein
MSSSADGARSLAEIQGWLRLAVTTPGGLRAGVRLADERYGGGLPIRVPAGGSPGERLSIYARGYRDRLLSCLRGDYPAVRALLGDEIFDAFALDFLGAHPPRHYSIFALGDGFADHLLATCPTGDAVSADRASLLRLPIDLARLERARLEVIRAPGVEGRPFAEPGFNALGVLFGDERLVAATPCLRVVELEHDVRGFVAAVERGEPPEKPAPRPTWIAVSRFDYRLASTEIAPWQQRALAACRSPRAAVEIAQELAAASGEDRGATLADLLLWLPVAGGLGMVTLASRSDGPP